MNKNKYRTYSWAQIAEIRQGRIDKLLEEVAALRGEVERLGKDNALLVCENMKLEGELARMKSVAPESMTSWAEKFRAIETDTDTERRG